jgi:integrase/recombinase XerD
LLIKYISLTFAPPKTGDVAQLVEQRTENPCVGGSIPSITTQNQDFKHKNFSSTMKRLSSGRFSFSYKKLKSHFWRTFCTHYCIQILIEMATVYTVLRKLKTSNELQPIYLCVTIGKERKYYSLKRLIDPKFWDEKAHKVKPRQGSANFLNSLIGEKEMEVRDIFHHFQFEDKPLTIASFDRFYKNGGIEISKNFYEFFESEMALKQKTLSRGVVLVYRQMVNKLKEFAPKLTIAEINHDLLSRFESYLLSDCALNRNTASKHLNTLRTYIRSAYNKNLIKTYPFASFKIKKGVSNRSYLSELDVRAIAEVRLFNDGEANAREMFMFACFTGLRFSDLVNITWENIELITDQSGEISKILIFENVKTKQKIGIPLIKEALNLLSQKDTNIKCVRRCN